jgi:hypothetical protein
MTRSGGEPREFSARRLWTVLALSWVMLLGSQLAVASGTSVVSTSGGTISVAGSSSVSTVDLVAPIPAASDFQSAVLQISTPSLPGEGASNLSVQDVSSTSVWGWSGNFGQVTANSELAADNTTASTTLSLPPGQVVAGSAVVEATAGPLRSPYSVALDLGGSSVFSRSSANGFEPFSALGWGNQSSSITSGAAFSEANGSEILILGDQSGYLTIFDSQPPSVGVEVFQTGLAPPNPVEQIVAFPVKGFSQPEIAAISGNDLFMLLPLQGLKWDEVILTPPVPTSGVTPDISDVCEQTVQGIPSVFVALSDNVVAISNDTGFGAASGWQNPLGAWQTVAQPVSALACSTSSSGLTATVAVATGGEVELAQQTSTSLGALATITLPGQTAADALSMADSGQEVLIAATDGELYAAQNSTWQPVAVALATQSSALTCVATGSELGESIIGTCDSAGRIEVLTDPYSGTTIVLTSQTVPGLSSTPLLSFGSLYGAEEADAITNVGGAVYAAANDYEFHEAGVRAWLSGLNSALSIATPTTLSSGASVDNLPLALDVSGGSAALQSITIEFNATQAVALSATQYSIEASPAGSNGAGVEVSTTWKVSSDSAGLVHLVLAVTYLQPSSPSTLQSLDQWFAASWILIAGALGAVGAAFFLLGRLAYWKPAHRLPK